MQQNERLAKLEADVANLADALATLKADLKAERYQSRGWLRGIGIGIIVLFVTSMINFIVWLLNKVQPL